MSAAPKNQHCTLFVELEGHINDNAELTKIRLMDDQEYEPKHWRYRLLRRQPDQQKKLDSTFNQSIALSN